MAEIVYDREGKPVPESIVNELPSGTEVYEVSQGLPADCTCVFTSEGLLLLHPRIGGVYVVERGRDSRTVKDTEVNPSGDGIFPVRPLPDFAAHDGAD